MERVRTNTAHVARGPPANDALIVNVRGKDWPRGNWPLNFLSKIFPRHRRQREKNLPFQGAFRLSRNAYRVTIRNFTKQLRRRGRGERERAVLVLVHGWKKGLKVTTTLKSTLGKDVPGHEMSQIFQRVETIAKSVLFQYHAWINFLEEKKKRKNKIKP